MKLRLSVIAAFAFLFFSEEIVFAQQYTLSCKKDAAIIELTESKLCADQECIRYLQTVRDTLAKIQGEDGKPVKPDVDFLQVAKILRAISFGEYTYHKTIENYIESYLKSAKESQRIVDNIKAHLSNPTEQAIKDQADLEKAQKRSKELLAIRPITTEVQKELDLLQTDISVIQKTPRTAESQRQLLPDFQKKADDSLAFAAKLEKQIVLSKNVDLSNREESFIRNLYILYKHRLEMVKARPAFRNCNFRDAEIYAIFHYTGFGAYYINRHLHGTSDVPSTQQWADFIQQGLFKIADYQKVVERGGTLSAEQISAFKKGYEFVFPAFMSTSTTIAFPKAYRFTIQSKTGKYVAPLSLFPQEEEVLFSFNSRFRVLDVKGNHYFLEELNSH